MLDAVGHAYLTDFGLSKEGIMSERLEPGKTNSFCGSVAYLAPEMIKRQGHTHAIDLYGLGVLMYEMLAGIPPFYTRDRDQLFHNIQHALTTTT